MGCIVINSLKKKLIKLLEEEDKTNRMINEIIHCDKMNQYSEVKTLILGTNTNLTFSIFNYLKIVGGISLNDRLLFKQEIVRIIITSMQKIIEKCVDMNYNFGDITQTCEMIMKLEDTSKLTPDITSAIKKLFENEVIKIILQKLSAFQLVDNAVYFLQAFDRITEEDYIPSNEDIFRIPHVPNKGVMETTFDYVSMNFKYIYYDSGNQNNDRMKYLQCFSDINLLIYCSDLSIYDDVEKLLADVKNFSDAINSRWFKNTPVLLLFKKWESNPSTENKVQTPLSDFIEREYLTKLFFGYDNSEGERITFCHLIDDISEIVPVVFEVQKLILSNCDYDYE